MNFDVLVQYGCIRLAQMKLSDTPLGRHLVEMSRRSTNNFSDLHTFVSQELRFGWCLPQALYAIVLKDSRFAWCKHQQIVQGPQAPLSSSQVGRNCLAKGLP
jgi:hypothetical protein